MLRAPKIVRAFDKKRHCSEGGTDLCIMGVLIMTIEKGSCPTCALI